MEDSDNVTTLVEYLRTQNIQSDIKIQLEDFHNVDRLASSYDQTYRNLGKFLVSFQNFQNFS